MKTVIERFSDNSERVQYDTEAVPVYIRRGLLSYYPNYAAASHWHNDVELIRVLSGKMFYNVNGEKTLLNTGEGIFVNSRQLHFGYSTDFTECEFLCVLFHPMLLCANAWMEQQFILPLIQNEGYPYQFLSGKSEWQQEILLLIGQIYESKGNAVHPLTAQSLIYQIWARLISHMPYAETHSARRKNVRLSSLQSMIGFIQEKYTEKISLPEIAASGNMCQSSCCAVFQQYLHLSPVRYLTEYRLYKSTVLLRCTDMNITDISYASGFSSASYYTETFRKCLGCTPTEYRNNGNRTSSGTVDLAGSVENGFLPAKKQEGRQENQTANPYATLQKKS